MVVFLTEIIPIEVRTSVFSVAYSLATAVFGGFTPAIAGKIRIDNQDGSANCGFREYRLSYPFLLESFHSN